MDAVFSILIENLVGILVNEACQVLEFHNQFKTTKKEVLRLQSNLKDIDKVRNKHQMETLKTITKELRDLLYDAEDIITNCELFLKQQKRIRESKCKRYCSSLKFRYKMGKRLQRINQEIRIHREEMTPYLCNLPHREHAENSRLMTYPVLLNDDKIVGLDDDLKKIKQWVLEAHGPLMVIGVVGIGGIGKTTLVQKIYDDDTMKDCFDHTFFVTISQSFELKEIIKGMLRKLNVNEETLSQDVYALLDELHENLKEKKYLVILDDVWGIDEDPWWESLKSALPQQNDCSCVIVTTRKEEVAQSMGATEMHIHHPKILSDEDSWSLFSKIAFAREIGRCPNPNLEGIGKEIVAICRGLPLVIKVVGGMMLGKDRSVDQWRWIFENLKEELVGNKDDQIFISILKLSYKDLPIHLKPCLLCFSVFLEDSEIDLIDMVHWWIGEGFVRGKEGKTAYEIGEEYFIELISRCLLLNGDKDIWERRILTCRIHDMVRDMIIKIAKEENFIGFDDNGSQSRRVGRGRHTTGMDISSKTNLRAVVGIKIGESKEFALNVVKPQLYQLKWLRVLSISFDKNSMTGVDELPVTGWLTGIESLQQLISLKIENSQLLDGLPDCIGSLLNLQILWLYNCPNLKRLPAQLMCLEKLTILATLECYSLECLPMGIGNLSQLQQLRGFVPTDSRTKDGVRFSELKKLTQLRKLRMEIKSGHQIQEGDLNVLSALNKLKKLVILFKDEINEQEQLIRKVDCEIGHIQQLQELYLFKYPGVRTPAWLNPTSLPNLQFLCIYGGNLTHMSPEFFGKNKENRFEKLEGLSLEGLTELEVEWPTLQRKMPSLRLLKVQSCPKLKSLPPCHVDRYGYATWRKE